MNRTLKIGTRASPLALNQAEQVASAILATESGFDVEIVKIVSSGDKIQDRSLSEIGGKGLFAKELENALLDGRIDLAVHSVKDLETNLPQGLMLAATVKREDARDVLISRTAASVGTLPRGAKTGSASARRKAQLLAVRPDLDIKLIRGNVAGRLARVESGEFDATILAAAGLDRLGLLDDLVARGVAHPLEIDDWLPAVCQGIVGIEIAEASRTDPEFMELMEKLDDPESRFCAGLERRVLRELDGSCKSAVSVHCRLKDGKFNLEARVYSADGTRVWEASRIGAQDFDVALEEACRMGTDLYNQAREALV